MCNTSADQGQRPCSAARHVIGPGKSGDAGAVSQPGSRFHQPLAFSLAVWACGKYGLGYINQRGEPLGQSLKVASKHGTGMIGFSGQLGFMSVASWMLVYAPQFYENYSLQSGEGLSMMFVVTWLIGDITNLFGAMMAKLLPSVIILAVYYTICDVYLVWQVYYYRWKRSRRMRRRRLHPESESSPLLRTAGEDIEGEEHKWMKYVPRRSVLYFLGVVWIVGAGAVALVVARRHPSKPEEEVLEWKSQALGWTSAVCYLGSRIPQIMKNAKTKCAGLSLALFVFALLGNVTYVASILVVSRSKNHLLANSSWLAGSALTMFLDFFVLYQFFKYRREADRLPDEPI